jgi:hypothetical protein
VKKSYQMMIYVFMIGCILVGGLLGIYLIGREEGYFDFELAQAVVVGVAGGSFLAFLGSLWHKKRQGKIPKYDERSFELLKRYLLVTYYFVMIGSAALLLVLFFMGVDTIETGALIAYMAVLFMVIALGALVTKRI